LRRTNGAEEKEGTPCKHHYPNCAAPPWSTNNGGVNGLFTVYLNLIIIIFFFSHKSPDVYIFGTSRPVLLRAILLSIIVRLMAFFVPSSRNFYNKNQSKIGQSDATIQPIPLTTVSTPHQYFMNVRTFIRISVGDNMCTAKAHPLSKAKQEFRAGFFAK